MTDPNRLPSPEKARQELREDPEGPVIEDDVERARRFAEADDVEREASQS